MPGSVALPGASRRTCRPAVPPLRPGAPPPRDRSASGLSLVVDDSALAADPAADAKARQRRMVQVLWWVHQWLGYRRALARLGANAPGLPMEVTLADVKSGASLTLPQLRCLRHLEPHSAEPDVLRAVASAADA